MKTMTKTHLHVNVWLQIFSIRPFTCRSNNKCVHGTQMPHKLMLDKEFTFDRPNVTLTLKGVASKYPGAQVHMLTGIELLN